MEIIRLDIIQKIFSMRSYRSRQERKKPKNDEEACGICYVSKGNTEVKPCQHKFCRTCLIQWMRIKRNCPFCRDDIKRLLYKNSQKQVSQFIKPKTRTNLHLVYQVPPAQTNQRPQNSFHLTLSDFINIAPLLIGRFQFQADIVETKVEVGYISSSQQQQQAEEQDKGYLSQLRD